MYVFNAFQMICYGLLGHGVLGWPRIHKKSNINLLPISYGPLGIIDGIYVRDIQIPAKSSPTKHPENGPKLKKSGFSTLSE